MKKIIVVSFALLMGCSHVVLVENWKNPDIVLFDTNKVLLVGMAQNQNVREEFESRLKDEFTKRNVEAWRSLDIFDVSLTNSKKTEKDLDAVEQSLLDKDFDAILLTKITGSENRVNFMKSITLWESRRSRFTEDYLEHQDIYYDEDYYDNFTVYHAETTLYCICEGSDRAMIWRGIIEITDPKNINKAVDDYIKLVLATLEGQDLIFVAAYD